QLPMLPLTAAYQAVPITAYRSIPQTAIATNGKGLAFRIKTKGVRYA
ncbi:unnamed protein product, partial [marine sediment metagenome]